MQRLGYKITKWIIILMATSQLAFSQIHISAIKNMFTPQIGFYLFVFILFGLILVFLLSSAKALDASLIFKVSLSTLVASGAAVYCMMIMNSDYKANSDVIKLSSFQTSETLMIAGIAVYVLGTLAVIISCIIDRRRPEN